MGRHQAGDRASRRIVLARVAAVAGIVCATGVAVAVPAMAVSPAPTAAQVVDGTVCTTTARACVDLVSQKAWLIDKNGNVIRGPVPITSGGMGKETPVGTFNVQWKDKTHTSQEFRTPQGAPAPMPWSVFWADGGIAFHGGSLARASAGCVHLADSDAEFFYNTLKLGDEVQVHAGNDLPAPERSTADRSGDDARPADQDDRDNGRSDDAAPASSAPRAATDDAPRASSAARASSAPRAATDSAPRSSNAPAATRNGSTDSARERQPGTDDRADPDRGLDLNRSPVGSGPLSHGL